MPFQPPPRCPVRCDVDENQCLLYEGHEAEHYFSRKMNSLVKSNP
ncbi:MULTISPECIES: hypothetical protein [Nitrosopumilus]|nr:MULTISPECIES: hypothetical protein [Nitrosopumilus]